MSDRMAAPRGAHRTGTLRSSGRGSLCAGRRGEVVKRAIDIVLGAVLALAVLPVVIVLAVALSLSLRSWPFFTQERVGQGIRPFRIVKLRTLPRSVPRYALKPDLCEVSIPGLARFLRRHHLDELPQLALVPIGRMSLVGPRPKLPDHSERMDPSFNRHRTQVRQGCSGLWQIGPDSDKLIRESPEYDEFYVHHRSVRLDAWILWRTARLMLGLGRHCGLTDVPAWALSRGGTALDGLDPKSVDGTKLTAPAAGRGHDDERRGMCEKTRRFEPAG